MSWPEHTVDVYGCRDCGAPIDARHGTTCPLRAQGRLVVRRRDCRVWGTQPTLPTHDETQDGQLTLT